MAQERVVRREVHEETVADGSSASPTKQVVKETVTESAETRQPAPASGVTNVNVNPADASGGNVSINTPDGTQVNVNT